MRGFMADAVISGVLMCLLASPGLAGERKGESNSPILKQLIFSITAEPEEGNAPLAVQFGVDLYDEDLAKPVFLWNFGDGTGAKGRAPMHTFKKAGDYRVTLRVEDTQDRVGSDEITVLVNKPE